LLVLAVVDNLALLVDNLWITLILKDRFLGNNQLNTTKFRLWISLITFLRFRLLGTFLITK